MPWTRVVGCKVRVRARHEALSNSGRENLSAEGDLVNKNRGLKRLLCLSWGGGPGVGVQPPHVNTKGIDQRRESCGRREDGE